MTSRSSAASPGMNTPPSRPLILTARFDPAAEAYFNQLRRQYFPSERNFIDAHVTLFHSLPGDEIARLRETKQHLSERFPLSAATTGVRFLGRGVAYDIACPALVEIRAGISQEWREYLTRQDAQQGFRPHITIQNKVAPEVARALQTRLTEEFQPLTFAFTALDIWHYDGGPWLPDRADQH